MKRVVRWRRRVSSRRRRSSTVAAAYLEKVDGVNYLCAMGFSAYLLLYIAVNTSTVTFERSLLDEESPWFDESIVRFEDVDLWFRLAERTRFAYVDEVQTLVRKHAQSITASDPVSTRIDGIVVRRKHLARLRPRLSAAEVASAERNIGELQFHVAYAEWCAGQDSSARRWFLDSWRSRPTIAAAGGLSEGICASRPPGAARRWQKLTHQSGPTRGARSRYISRMAGWLLHIRRPVARRLATDSHTHVNVR